LHKWDRIYIGEIAFISLDLRKSRGAREQKTEVKTRSGTDRSRAGQFSSEE
jgi:hypothetical protein